VRELDVLQRSLDAIRRDWGGYNARRLDFKGGYPNDSMPEHVSGSSEPGMLELDDTQRKLDDGWKLVRASIQTATIALRGIEHEMAWVVNTTRRPDDPAPRACANQHCPDAKVFNMIDDKPHSLRNGRCEACRKFMERNGRERTTINAYRLASEIAG
jgi:hypothetical protein